MWRQRHEDTIDGLLTEPAWHVEVASLQATCEVSLVFSISVLGYEITVLAPSNHPFYLVVVVAEDDSATSTQVQLTSIILLSISLVFWSTMRPSLVLFLSLVGVGLAQDSTAPTTDASTPSPTDSAAPAPTDSSADSPAPSNSTNATSTSQGPITHTVGVALVYVKLRHQKVNADTARREDLHSSPT